MSWSWGGVLSDENQLSEHSIRAGCGRIEDNGFSSDKTPPQLQLPPFILEEPILHDSGKRYVLELDTLIDLRGRHICVQTDEGGSYNAIIE